MSHSLVLADNQDEDDDDEMLANETDIEEVPIKYLSKPIEEPMLSQKLSQLSVSHRTNDPITMLKENGQENIPEYLSKGSKSFEQIINQVSSLDKIEELRQMAIRIYQLSMINLEKSLWLTYWKAGMGKLQLSKHQTNKNNYQIGPKLWPIEIQSKIKESTITDEKNNACLHLVTEHLSELDKKLNKYQAELMIKKDQLTDHVQIIETFIQQELAPIHLTFEYQIALVEYNYRDRVLELEYLQHNPTHDQKKLAKQLCHAKYQEEITKEEFHLLKEHISNQQESTESSKLPHETFFNTLEDQDIRRKLNDQYTSVAQQARQDMMELCLSSAESQVDRYRKQFNAKWKQFGIEQLSLPQDKKLSSIMIHLIEERYKNIIESINCTYKYKANIIHLNSTNH